jgi:hypothetical protein
VECALKACIAKQTQRHDFPEKKRVDASYTHSLKELVRVANLEDLRRHLASTEPQFDENWGIVEAWSGQSRYATHPMERARQLLDAIADPNHGVIKWIRRYW